VFEIDFSQKPWFGASVLKHDRFDLEYEKVFSIQTVDVDISFLGFYSQGRLFSRKSCPDRFG
jgi:hypothetical protein